MEPQSPLKNTRPKNKSVPLNLLFLNENYYIHKGGESKLLKLNHEILMDLVKLVKSGNITGIMSIIDYCKANSFIHLQLIFEWIYYHNYLKEDFTKRKGSLFGIIELLDDIRNENEEIKIRHGFKIYTSKTRTILLNFIEPISNNLFKNKNRFMYLFNCFLLDIINLRFQSAIENIREIISNKAVTDHLISIILSFEEVSKNYLTSNFDSLSAFVINLLMSSLERLPLEDEIKFAILFLLQKPIDINAVNLSPDIFCLIKLSYMLKYCPKEELIINLINLKSIYTKEGAIEGILITGSSQESVQLINNFIDKSDDILISYILKSILFPGQSAIIEKTETELFLCLNKLQNFNERIVLQNKVRDLTSQPLQSNKSITDYIITCHFCQTKLSDKNIKDILINNKENKDTLYIDFCPRCTKKLPSCCICLYPIELSTNLSAGKQKYNITKMSFDRICKGDNLDDVFVNSNSNNPDLRFIWCVKCRHGGHINHIKKWFEDLEICPVPDCECICSDNNHLVL